MAPNTPENGRNFSSRSLLQVDVVEQPSEVARDSRRRLVGGANDEDASVAAGWVCADVAEAAIERDHETLDTRGGAQNDGVLGTAEVLVGNRVYVVIRRSEPLRCARRDVLVELDPHWAATAGYSSRARSAP